MAWGCCRAYSEPRLGTNRRAEVGREILSVLVDELLDQLVGVEMAVCVQMW